MPEVDPTNVAVGVGGTGALLWAIRYFRRLWSNDQVQMREDRAKIDIFNVLETQLKETRDRAERAEKERNEALIKMGGMEGQIMLLSFQLNSMREEVARLHQELQRNMTEMAEMREKLNAPWNIQHATDSKPTR